MTFQEWWKIQSGNKYRYWLDSDLKPDYQAEKEARAIALSAWKAGRRELKKKLEEERDD